MANIGWVWFDGGFQGLKILYEGPDGSFYISGDRGGATLVSPPAGSGFDVLQPLGIVATGPGLDDWVVGGYGIEGGGGRSLIFWGPTGIVETIALAVPNTQILSAGNFLSTINATLDAGLWATLDDSGSSTGDFNSLGYVLPDVIAVGTDSIGVDLSFRSASVSVDRDLAYALVSEPGGTQLYSAVGGSVSSAFLPGLISQTTLIWPYAYAIEVDYVGGEPLPEVGAAAIALDIYELTEAGDSTIVESQTVEFYSPGPDAIVLDISYHPPD